jgi:hypothetical protein
MNMKLIGTLIVALAAPAFVPAASANLSACDPTGSACVGDETFGSGSCSNGFQEGYDYASVFLLTGQYVYAQGYDYCFGFGGFQFNGNGVSAGGCDFNTFTCVGAGWDSYGGSFGSGCDMYVYAVVVYENPGCPAGSPPAVPWGTLTP